MRQPLTVFTHFYNEEVLLPFWLEHHVKLFEHGVLIDYASTDRSREIIREKAPHWEVRASKNEFFGATACDLEVMATEREFGGWKLALNVTEFLFHEDLRAYLERFEAQHPEVPAIGIPSFVMVDRVADAALPLTSEPLWRQRTHGYFDGDRRTRRLRYLHRERDGAYEMGRHGTGHRSVEAQDLALLWFGWSPYAQIRARKLQIQMRMPESDKQAGWGWQHLVTPEQLDARFQDEARKTRSLLEDPRYERTFSRMTQLLEPRTERRA
jgi:hypothetical protein